MKSKLLPIILFALVVLNGVLIFMLIKKPHKNKKLHPERVFLAEQLQFSENQRAKFINLDEAHKQKMMNLDHQIMKQKDILFNALENEKINIDSLVNITGKLEAQKDLEIFTFFNAVKKICTKNQQEQFKIIINKARKGGKPEGSPMHEGKPPHKMPPPSRDF